MMFCQSCGQSLEENAQFCSKCAAPKSKSGKRSDSSQTVDISINEQNAIWNPNAASNWSLIFSPAFGSYLHALNWRTLGEQDRASFSMGWFYFSLAMLVVYIFMSVFIADEKAADGAIRGLGLLYLIIWYFSAGRSQAKYVKAKFGEDYPRRGWVKPLLIGVAAIIGYFILAVAVVFTLGMVMA